MFIYNRDQQIKDWRMDADCSPVLDDADYDWMMVLRRIILPVSSLALISNVVIIIVKRQYVYNTIKLLMFLEIFYVLSLMSVEFHTIAFNNHQVGVKSISCVEDVVNQMISNHQMYACSIEAFLNLFFYNISYLFAVLITFYVRKVLDNSHKNFMKKYIKVILLAAIGILIIFLVPFALSFIDNVLYSFGPNGFFIEENYYFFYCGPVSRSGDTGSYLSLANMMIIPLVLLIIHAILLCKNYRSKSSLRSMEGLNPRQWFIIRSGKLSLFVFCIQLLNGIKLGVVLLFEVEHHIVIAINIFFDILPIFLVLFYFTRYYKTGKSLEESSLLRSESDSLVTTKFEVI